MATSNEQADKKESVFNGWMPPSVPNFAEEPPMDDFEVPYVDPIRSITDSMLTACLDCGSSVPAMQKAEQIGFYVGESLRFPTPERAAMHILDAVGCTAVQPVRV